MSVVLKFNINKTSNCEEFIFNQTTGLYNITDNETGWGIPNEELIDVLESNVIIKDLTNNVEYEKIEITASDDSSDNIIFYDLIIKNANSSIQIEKIRDGIYCFEHLVLVDGNIILSSTNYFLSLCEIECKLKQLSIKFINSTNTSCSPCENELLKSFLEAMSLYEALKFSYQCGNFDDFNKILRNLQDLLRILNCKNC